MFIKCKFITLNSTKAFLQINYYNQAFPKVSYQLNNTCKKQTAVIYITTVKFFVFNLHQIFYSKVSLSCRSYVRFLL